LIFLGWIAERYGYKLSLIIAGIFMGISGFVTLLIPLIGGLCGKEEDTNKKEQTIETHRTTIRSDSLR
jgi:MFS family permease